MSSIVLDTGSKQHGGGKNIISPKDCWGDQDVAWLCPRHASLHHFRLHRRLLQPWSATDDGAKWIHFDRHSRTVMDL